MKTSSIFSNEIAINAFTNQIINELNIALRNMPINSSPRMIGDFTQDIIEEFFRKKLPDTIGTPIQEKFARRAMADLAFTDIYNNYIIVDVKTHNLDTSFNMPNLTSVERLARFYEDDSNYFSVMIIEYAKKNNFFFVSNIFFIPIEFLNWDCLTIGALGWGQIQIANANTIHINTEQTRKNWMLSMCDVLDIFYPKEKSKIDKRISYFSNVRNFWESK